MKTLSIILIAIVIFGNYSFSQVKGFSTFEPDKLMQQSSDRDMLRGKLTQQEQMPVGNIVEPEHYRLGPGDVLIYLPPPYVKEEMLIVTPENTIVIPKHGTFNVKDKNLQELKDTLNKVITEINPQNRDLLSLYQSRQVLVTISGNVAYQGNYYLPASYQVSTAIKFANEYKIRSELPNDQMIAMLRIMTKQSEIDKTFSESGLSSEIHYSSRNITLIHRDGTSQNIDLIRSMAYGEVENDPYIREGDIINLPFENVDFPSVSINGSVINPISVCYKQGDKLSFLLKLARGERQNADLDNVYLFEPKTGVKTKLRVGKGLELQSEDTEISEGSIIIVGEQEPKRSLNYGTVSIKGNVMRPGVYLVEHNVTRLKDVINTAGGFTNDAYLPLASIMRRSNEGLSKTSPILDIKEYFQYSDLSLEDTTRYMIDIYLKKPLVSCNFESAFLYDSDKDNVRLHDGDVITVPSNPRKVFVFGQVNQPGYVEFEENKNLQWYVEKAGGYGPRAEAGRARIIRGKTLVWMEGGDNIYVNAGDLIYVPRPPDIPKSVELQNYGLITSIILAAVSITSIIINLVTK